MDQWISPGWSQGRPMTADATEPPRLDKEPIGVTTCLHVCLVKINADYLDLEAIGLGLYHRLL